MKCSLSVLFSSRAVPPGSRADESGLSGGPRLGVHARRVVDGKPQLPTPDRPTSSPVDTAAIVLGHWVAMAGVNADIFDLARLDDLDSAALLAARAHADNVAVLGQISEAWLTLAEVAA